MEASNLELRTSRRPRRARLRGLVGNRSPAMSGLDAELLQALEAEVTLLREENACLRAAQETVADPARVISRLAELRRPADDAGHGADHGDDAWHVLTAALVLRDTLLEVCGEIAQAMAVQEERLRAMSAGLGLDGPAARDRSVTDLRPAVGK